MTDFSVALSRQVHDELITHLLREDYQEDLCFALWYPSAGTSRRTALIHTVLLPVPGERQLHGNASFLPNYFERAVTEARRAGAGLAFFHSHGAPGWQDMSEDDVNAELGHAAATMGATGLPLVGLTLGTDGAWSARFWERTAPRTYARRWCALVRVVGEQLSLTFDDEQVPPPLFKEALRRTVSAWGEKAQADLARLRIGVVGGGSVGAIVAEALARIGVVRLKLIDFDAVEELNRDRLLHATAENARHREPKVKMLGRALKQSATADGFQIDEIEYSVCEEEGFRAALDCDVLFSCVDRPWPRAVLNFIAYAHLIPVIDGGLLVGVKSDGSMRRADWKAHIASPDRRCLECLKQYDPALVSVERDGYLDDPSYIQGLPKDHPIRRNENVFPFSLAVASMELLQMIMMVVTPAGVANAGAQAYHFIPGFMDEPSFQPCDSNCLYPSLTGRGDTAGLTVTGKHAAAEAARAARQRSQRQSLRDRVGRWLRQFLAKQ